MRSRRCASLCPCGRRRAVASGTSLMRTPHSRGWKPRCAESRCAARRHRPWLGDQPRLGARHGRRPHRREHAGSGQHLHRDLAGRLMRVAHGAVTERIGVRSSSLDDSVCLVSARRRCTTVPFIRARCFASDAGSCACRLLWRFRRFAHDAARVAWMQRLLTNGREARRLAVARLTHARARSRPSA